MVLVGIEFAFNATSCIAAIRLGKGKSFTMEEGKRENNSISPIFDWFLFSLCYTFLCFRYYIYLCVGGLCATDLLLMLAIAIEYFV